MARPTILPDPTALRLDGLAADTDEITLTVRGCRNARGPRHEIAMRRYPGAYRGVARVVAELKRRERTGEPLVQATDGLLPRQVLGLHDDLRRAAALLGGSWRPVRERTEPPAADVRLARRETEALTSRGRARGRGPCAPG
jgi:hypothetical protein